MLVGALQLPQPGDLVIEQLMHCFEAFFYYGLCLHFRLAGGSLNHGREAFLHQEALFEQTAYIPIAKASRKDLENDIIRTVPLSLVDDDAEWSRG